MQQGEVFGGLAVALGVGFLIGLQREQAVAGGGGTSRSLGGIRTYPLAALLGAACSLLARPLGPWIVGGGLLVLLVPIAIGYVDDVRRDRDRGITSEVAFVLTYLLGVLALTPDLLPTPKDRLLVTAAVGVAAGALLSLKRPLHAWVARISSTDIYATVKFAVLAVIVLPLLPDRAYGPYAVVNPFHVGLMIVLIAGVSFVGYVAVRALGPGRGMGITGLVGGLASSTAVTLSLSSRAKREPDAAGPYALGVVLASAVMAVRVVAEVAVVNQALVPAVAIPIGAMAAAGSLAALLLRGTSASPAPGAAPVHFANPFELGSALKLGAIFVGVLILSKAAQIHFGSSGMYVASTLGGLTDVDAVTLSMARMARDGLPRNEAVTSILLAIGANTIVKAGMTVALGGWALGRRTLPAFLAMALAGAGGVAWLWLRP
jgi:uncharacterized membrane protein (DUF4010 family)